MKSNLAIKMQVNLPRLLANLGHAFSKPVTVVSELLQNARRAGATQVIVNYNSENKVLTVEDDGCGIADFQNLFTIAESGWDQQIQDDECPYGMGFLAALYAADHIEATSTCGTVSFKTQHALQFGEVPVAAGTQLKTGSFIGLSGFKADINEWVMEQMVKGFPLPVIYNGKVLPRPHAVENLSYVESAIGQVSMRGIHSDTGKKNNGFAVAYLLGFQVYKNSGVHNACDNNIIHLNPRLFHARMPDRACLVDPDAAAKKMDAEMSRLWRQHLEMQFHLMSALDFLGMYEEPIFKYHPDLLNDIPFVPGSITTRMEYWPSQRDRYNPHVAGITREQVEAGDIILCTETVIGCEEDVLPTMFAWKGNFTMVRDNNLPDGHWAKPFIRHIENETFTVTVNRTIANGSYCGGWTSGEAVVCESYTINSDTDSNHGPRNITFIDEPMYCDLPDTEKICFLFPGGCTDGSVVRQASNYEDEWDVFNDTDCNEDDAELTRVVNSLRGATPASILDDLLSSIYWHKYDMLKGKTFAIQFPANGARHIEEVIDAEHH